jgi:hypothetical protein
MDGFSGTDDRFLSSVIFGGRRPIKQSAAGCHPALQSNNSEPFAAKPHCATRNPLIRAVCSTGILAYVGLGAINFTPQNALT